ncbi:MAG: BamA/TamA family outer membrane protein, partial [bacterium]|nr:BamA/TamA family outer membrane protein [bacterium]
IQRGEEAARRALPEIRQFALQQKVHPGKKRELFQPSETVVVNEIKIKGLNRTTALMVKTRIGFDIPAELTANELEKTVNNIYSTGFYERVYYRLHENAAANTMEIFVIEKESDQLRFGFHYDSDQKAAAILNATLRNIYRGSLTTIDVVLGNEEHYRFSHSVTTNQKPRLGLRFFFDHERSDGLLFNAVSGKMHQRLRETTAGIFVGTVYSSTFVGGVGTDWNYHTSSDIISDTSFAPTITEIFYSWYASLQYETLDRINFPTSGAQFTGIGKLAERRLGSRRNFRMLRASGAGYLPIAEGWTASTGFQIASNVGDELPSNSSIPMGGIDDFLGYEYREVNGNHKQIARIGLQWEPWPNKFLLLRANTGNVFEKWQWNVTTNRYVAGWGVTAGWLTVAGPLQFTVHGSVNNTALYNFRFGYMF